MSIPRLAIPLNSNPARQKLWRAVGSLLFIAVAIGLGYTVDRYLQYRSSPQLWPTAAVLQIKVTKTPQTLAYLDTNFSGVSALPGAPWSLEEAMSWSKREFLIYTDNQDIVGIMVDGEVPPPILNSLNQWGWQSFTLGKRHLIVSQTAAEPLEPRHRFNFWLTLPVFDGLVSFVDDSDKITAIPFRYSSATSLDFPVNMEAFIPTTTLSLGSDTTLTASAAIPVSLANQLTPAAISATFPGLKQLSSALQTGGMVFVLGEDELGPAFSLSTPPTAMSLEELGAIAQESLSLQNLSTAVLTINDMSSSQEIRGGSDISVDIQTTDGIATAIAKDSQGQIFRLTQSNHQLIVSNRMPIIGVNTVMNSEECLNKPAGFIKPSHLTSYLPTALVTNYDSLAGRLTQADQVAFRKNRLRICW